MKYCLFFVSLFILAACVPVPTRPDQTIETNPGKTFQITINSNPTTGYDWEIVGELDKNVQFVSKDYQNVNPPGIVGGGGVDIWTFKAIATGQATITLGLYRPSNTTTDPARTETFTVSVK